MPRIKRLGGHGDFGGGAQRRFIAISYTFILLCWSLGVVFIVFPRATHGGGSAPSRPQAISRPASSSAGTARTKIAEGEYAIYQEANSGAVGPFGEEVYDFHESWTLWRTEKRQYEVEGERKFESPRHTAHTDRFRVELSRDMTAIRATEFGKLRWRRDSGPLTCDFLRKELHCSSGARDPQQAIDLRIPMEHPFGVLWPISPFSLASLTRQAERDASRGTRVQLLSVEQPSAYIPVQPIIRDGQLRYLGAESIEAADQKWRAYKFSLKVPSLPPFLIWTSSKGLLLALTIEHAQPDWPQEGMKLVRFQKWADF